MRNGYTYQEYLDLIETLLAHNKTTGTDHSPDMISKTRLNLQRMRRITKTCKLDDPLQKFFENIRQPMIFVVIAEAWCGDGAQAIPYISAIARLNTRFRLSILLRDEHPEIMDCFLTEGKRSIPKLICLDRDFHVLSTWGPRPIPANEIFKAYKNNPDKSKEEFYKELHLWYARDNGKSILNEIQEMIENCLHHSENMVQ